MRDLYKPVSKYYNLLSSCYSLGQIPRCRKAFIDEISEAVMMSEDGIEVCFVGVGHGDEAISVAQLGAMVTVVDISASMLDAFQRKLNQTPAEVKQRVTVIHDDICNISHEYDWVIANFFLNVFSEDEMLEMLDALLEKCRSQGSLVIGDFHSDAESNCVVRFLQKANWYVALTIFRMFVRNAKHPIYAYQQHLIERGWQVARMKKFGVLGMTFYASSRYYKMSGDA